MANEYDSGWSRSVDNRRVRTFVSRNRTVKEAQVIETYPDSAHYQVILRMKGYGEFPPPILFTGVDGSGEPEYKEGCSDFRVEYAVSLAKLLTAREGD